MRLPNGLQELLAPGETVELAVKVKYQDENRAGYWFDKTLYLTSTRIIDEFHPARGGGLLSRGSPARVDDIPYDAITAIDRGAQRSGGLGGVLAMTRGGGMIHIQSRVRNAAYQFANADELARAEQLIRRKMQDAAARPVQVQQVSGQPDIPSQIQKLAELRDSRVISAEEFERKKKDLLDRM